MHILLIHQYFLEKDDGGGSRFNEMTKVWTAQGHKVTVLAGMVHYATGKKRERYKGKLIYKDQYDENITVYRCHVSESYNKSFVGRLWGYFSFVFWGIICGLFKAKGKFDLVLVTSPPLFVGIIGRWMAFWKRLPLVFEIRDLWPESAIDTGVLKNKFLIRYAYGFERRIYKKSKLINTLTPAFQRKLIDVKKVPADKVVMIPNAADFSLAEKLVGTFDVEKFRKDHGLEDHFVITYVGAHGVANHLIQLIHAAEKLQDTNVLFLLVGDGMTKPTLKKEAEERGLKNVKFIDSVPKEEVFKYIMVSDMGASVLKKVDTFKTIYSNKTFDYMSCKKPVLLLIDGVSRELVETANCGVYAEPENIDDIVSKIRGCLSLSDKLPEMGINGYQYAKEHFDREKLAMEYLNQLEKVAKKRK